MDYSAIGLPGHRTLLEEDVAVSYAHVGLVWLSIWYARRRFSSAFAPSGAGHTHRPRIANVMADTL